MADNDDASGSSHKKFWEMTMDMEEQPQPRYEAIEDDSTDPDYTTASSVGDDTSDGGAAETDPPLMMAANPQMAANRRGEKRTGTRTCSTPLRRNLLKWAKIGFERRPQN